MNPIHYYVSFEHPHQHVVHVEAHFSGLEGMTSLEVALPTWSAGSYLVRDYVQHLFDVSASSEGGSVEVSKAGKTVWRLDVSDVDACVFRYSVYCHDAGEVSPRGSHVVDNRAFLHFPTLIATPMEYRSQPLQLTIRPPSDWRLFSGMIDPSQGEVRGETTFDLPSVDYVYDTPLFAGEFHSYTFDVDNIPHFFVVNESLFELGIEEERFLSDLSALVRGNRWNFDHFPYRHYTFFLMICQRGGGGLEHHNSSVNIFTRDMITFPTSEAPYKEKDYISLLSLLAHENFHAWNVKEFGPAALCCPDFTVEGDTRDIWTVEGFANYFERRALLRSQLIAPETYLDITKLRINALEDIPGRRRDSLIATGEDAWIKFYKAHENNVNTTVSYYLKGSLVCALLDIEMLDVTDGKVGLHNLVDFLSKTCKFDRECGDPFAGGYPDGYLEEAVTKLTGVDFSGFFDKYVKGVDDLPYDDFLRKVGLVIEREDTYDYHLGLKFKSEGEFPTVTHVLEGSLGWRSGIYPGDMILALNTRSVKETTFKPIVRSFVDGGHESLQVHLFRNGRLHELTLPLTDIDGKTPVEKIVEDEGANEKATRLRALWLFQ